MRGSVLIILIHIMMVMSLLLITTFSIAQSHFLVSVNEDLHHEAYYLAESGMNFALEELSDITRQAFDECISEFKWDPLKYPLLSMQEAAQSHVQDKLGSKIRKIMTDRGCLLKFPSLKLPDVPDNAKVNVLVQFTNASENPSRLKISSRGEIGQIRRRIDSEIVINKISGYYNSLLFDWILISGGDVVIINGGELETNGRLYLKEDLLIKNGSILRSNSPSVVSGKIYLQESSTATFADEVFCSSLYAGGEPGSNVSFLSDLYTYGEISAVGEGNAIALERTLFACPDDESASVGVIAGNGGSVVLGEDVYINGTLNYPLYQANLFGLLSIPLSGERYKSMESIGGWNSAFYFPDFAPEYAVEYFTENFTSFDTGQQCELVYDYLLNPPSADEDLNNYNKHLAGITNHCINIVYEEGEEHELMGYTSGLIFANNKVFLPLDSLPSNKFFNDILHKMKKNTDWNFSTQLNPAIEVSNKNITLEGSTFSILDEDKPFIYITYDEKDILLPAGKYEGIVVTQGSILVAPNTQVEHKGLLIAGKDIVVEGSLIIHKDKDLLLDLLSKEDENFRRFFRVEPEANLFEIRYSKEVLYNLKW